jgi:hypothetical protein
MDIIRLKVTHGVTLTRHLFFFNVRKNTSLLFKTRKEMTLYTLPYDYYHTC